MLIIGLQALNLVLRKATRRLAVAPDGWLDERQERVRNHAYRLSHHVLAVAFGVPLWLLFLQLGRTSGTTPWLREAAGNWGLIVVYLELLYFLPTAAIARIEPDAPEDEVIVRRRLSRLQRLEWMALIAVILLPFVLSLTVAFAGRTTSVAQLANVPPPSSSLGICRYVGATKNVGVGVVGATIQLNGVFCANGKRIKRLWGLFHWDCHPQGTALTSVSMQCYTTFDAHGTMHLQYVASVRPALLPFINRRVTFHLVVRPDGRIIRFP